LSIPTASSVDGYTSFGAALLKDGFKQTIPCPAPLAVLADTKIMAAAPTYLSSSGYGDLAAKLIAGADYLLSDICTKLGESATEPIDPFAWSMTQTGLRGKLDAAADAYKGSTVSIATLFEALSVTGFAMQYSKSSRPVSGGEHLLSHIWEMENLEFRGESVTHGHKVSLGTMVMSVFMWDVYKTKTLPPIRKEQATAQEREAEVRNALAKEGLTGNMVDAAVKTALEKLKTPKQQKAWQEKLHDNWEPLRERVLEVLQEPSEIKEILLRGGCPTTPPEIGLTPERTLSTIPLAQMIRNRYTTLDLAWDLGIFDSAVNAVRSYFTK
jgi:glycerol-1-phosphate dehydrogenase [NAD(P)+]